MFFGIHRILVSLYFSFFRILPYFFFFDLYRLVAPPIRFALSVSSASVSAISSRLLLSGLDSANIVRCDCGSYLLRMISDLANVSLLSTSLRVFISSPNNFHYSQEAPQWYKFSRFISFSVLVVFDFELLLTVLIPDCPGVVFSFAFYLIT